MRKGFATLVFVAAAFFSNIFLYGNISFAQQVDQNSGQEEIWVEDPPEIILAENVPGEKSDSSGFFDLTNQEKVMVVSSGLWVLAAILFVLLIGYVRSTGKKGKRFST